MYRKYVACHAKQRLFVNLFTLTKKEKQPPAMVGSEKGSRAQSPQHTNGDEDTMSNSNMLKHTKPQFPSILVLLVSLHVFLFLLL